MLNAKFAEIERALETGSGDDGFAVALETLRAQWPSLLATAGDRVHRLLDSIPARLWHSDLNLVTCYAASFRNAANLQPSASLPYFEAGASLIDSHTPAIVRATFHVYFSAALRSLGRLDDALTAINQASIIAGGREEIPLASRVPLTAQIALHRGATLLHLGEFDRAKADFRLASSLAVPNLTAADQVELFGGLAIIHAMLGNFDDSLRHATRAEELATESTLRNSRFHAPALIAELIVTLYQLGPGTGEELVSRINSAAPGSDWEPLGLYAEAFSHLFANNPHDGLDVLRSALDSLDDWQPASFVVQEISGLRAAGFLQLYEPGGAWDVLATLSPTQRHTVCPARLAGHLRLVRGDHRGTLEEIRDCELLGDAHSARTLVDIHLLKAAAHLGLGDEARSDVAFDRALRLSERNTMICPFRLVPNDTVHDLLSRAANRNQPPELLSLIKRLDSITVLVVADEIDTLSDRERAITRELIRGNNSTQIAETLYISVNTVKSHLKSVYRKLGVTSRADAVHRARELGIQIEITHD